MKPPALATAPKEYDQAYFNTLTRILTQYLSHESSAPDYFITTMYAADGKTTPVAADTIPLIDSAGGGQLTALTWANLWGHPGALGAISPNTGAFTALNIVTPPATNASVFLLAAGTQSGALETQPGAGGTLFLTGNGTGGLVFRTGATANTQVQIGDTASANRYLTLTGSNGGNPTIGVSGGELAISSVLTLSQTTLLKTSVALTNGAAAQVATMTNGPTAGNPTKWIPINDNGTTRYLPAW